MRDIKRIILHCSDGWDDTVDSIRAFHTALPPEGRGWQDIGYHYVITPDGLISTGRSPDQIGAHCYGHNDDSLGVCLVGRRGRYTIKAILSLRSLLDTLRGIYGVGQSGIYCHHELDDQGKTCPDFNKEDLFKLL